MSSKLQKLISSIIIDSEQKIGPNSRAFVNSLRDIEGMRGLEKIKEKVAKHLTHARKQVERGKPCGFHNIIITGGPGRGKTQLAMHIGRAFVTMGFFKDLPNQDAADVTFQMNMKEYIRVMRVFRKNAAPTPPKGVKSPSRIVMKRRNRITTCLSNACIQNAIFNGVQGLENDSKQVITDVLNGKYDDTDDIPCMEIQSIENIVMETSNPPRVGKCIVYSKGDLVASYTGQTAPKTNRALKVCRGGVFILDEAYSLLNVTSEKEDRVCTFGLEALNTLNQYMSEHQSEQIVILCGYKDLIKSLYNVQRGLIRRFNWFYDIGDYSTSELVDIFFQKIPSHLESSIEKQELVKVFKEYKFDNQAGDMENLALQSEVMFDNDENDPKTLTLRHVREALSESHKKDEEEVSLLSIYL